MIGLSIVFELLALLAFKPSLIGTALGLVIEMVSFVGVVSLIVPAGWLSARTQRESFALRVFAAIAGGMSVCPVVSFHEFAAITIGMRVFGWIAITIMSLDTIEGADRAGFQITPTGTLTPRVRPTNDRGEPMCFACGYNLVGSREDGVCPECGSPHSD